MIGTNSLENQTISVIWFAWIFIVSPSCALNNTTTHFLSVRWVFSRPNQFATLPSFLSTIFKCFLINCLTTFWRIFHCSKCRLQNKRHYYFTVHFLRPTYELHWFRQHRHVAGMTLSVAAMDALARQSFGLWDQIYRFGAAEMKPAGSSPPELTELLLPFHSDDVIISYDFVRIFTHKNFLFTLRLFLLNIDFKKNYWFFLFLFSPK